MKMCKFGCSNPVLAFGRRTWPISQRERKTYLHKFRTKHLSMATAMGKNGKTWDTYGKIWREVTMNADFNGKYGSKYVELCEHICEHHENHR